MISRRHFLSSLALLPLAPRVAWARRVTHPEPRPGITAAKVLTREQLHDRELAPVFDLVRQMPQIADGIGCNCGCSTLPGMRSLLSCFEGEGMAQHCLVCQGEAKLAHRLFREGKTLAEIRAAIDREFV